MLECIYFFLNVCFLSLDDSPNFKSLGLSDACLATLASESKAARFVSSAVKDPYTSLEESVKYVLMPLRHLCMCLFSLVYNQAFL